MISVRSTVPAAAGLLLAVLAGTAGCKKKVPPPPPPDPVPVQKVETKLQITTLTPSSFQESTPASADLYGSGFAEGMQVKIGTMSVSGVRFIDPNAAKLDLPGMAAGRYDLVVSTPDGSSATLRDAVTVRAAQQAQADCRTATVYFDFDSSVVRADGRQLLDGYGSCYKQLTGQVRVEGHADERGTTDYNLALGQRRADAVRQHLTRLGVPAGRVRTVSYGEERPAVRGSSESAWAKNRRAEVTAE